MNLRIHEMGTKSSHKRSLLTYWLWKFLKKGRYSNKGKHTGNEHQVYPNFLKPEDKHLTLRR